MTKLIVFIETEKFKTLINNSAKLLQIGFATQIPGPFGNTTSYLPDNNILIVSDKSCAVGEITNLNNSEGKIFIIPDYKINKLIANDKINIAGAFKILYHTITERDYNNQLSQLKSKSVGYEKSVEEANTIYGDLARIIDNGKLSNELLDGFISKVKDFNPILEAKLELLHNCLHHESIPTALDTLLSEYSSPFEIFNNRTQGKTLFDEEYMEALIELRKALLGS